MALPFGLIEETRACRLTVSSIKELTAGFPPPVRKINSVHFTIEDDLGNNEMGYFFISPDFGTLLTVDTTYSCNAKLSVVTNDHGQPPRIGIVDIQFSEQWISEHDPRPQGETIYRSPHRVRTMYH